MLGACKNIKRICWCIVAMTSMTPLLCMAQSSFSALLKEKNYNLASLTDWSNKSHIIFDQPSCAYINITGIEKMPQSRKHKQEVWIEYYDEQGNYLRKRALMSAQGNSSLAFEKKNFKVDFSVSESENSTFTIGDWVEQDGFHFKAYYTDYFRGAGCVAYKLFDLSQADRGRMWKRASLSSAKANAKCYPDGFPCLVYLNDEFYGIYAWQLKKDRKNMGQKKDVAEHIHLDGTFDYGSLWGDKINWTKFEVRNPTGLYCMNGQPYDGDNPQELIDETSAFYDMPEDNTSVKDAKRLSANVKHYVESFGKFSYYLSKMKLEGATTSDIKDYMEERFDIISLIDYYCFSIYVNNFDGFWKNWQWFTYDGTKWFVAPYDLDCTFGNHYSGNFIIPPEWNYEGGNYSYYPTNGPISYLTTYFWEEIKERYAELRSHEVFTPYNVYTLFEEWHERIGLTAYDMEWERWPNSKCITTTVVNSPWITTDNWTDYGKTKDYNNETTYHAGNTCRAGYRIWTATTDCSGIYPYVQIGYTDSLQRVQNWLEQRTKIIDSFLSYSPLNSLRQIEKPFYSSHIYNMSGQRIPHLQKGLNIVRRKKVHVTTDRR